MVGVNFRRKAEDITPAAKERVCERGGLGVRNWYSRSITSERVTDHQQVLVL